MVPESLGVRLLSRNAPSWFGARSYGIYLYHYPLAGIVVFAPIFHFHGATHDIAVVAALSLTVVVAAASYRWIETPFLRLKDRVSVGTTPEQQPNLAPAT
jgi:peptidoglycan/LPS O-acetylase OafA/YrhL